MTFLVCPGPTIIGWKTFGHKIAMQPTTVTMMITVFRGPRVLPLDSIRLLTVAILMAFPCAGELEFTIYLLLFLSFFPVLTARNTRLLRVEKNAVAAPFFGTNFQFSPLFLFLASPRKTPAPERFVNFHLFFFLFFSRTTDRNGSDYCYLLFFLAAHSITFLCVSLFLCFSGLANFIT